MKDGIWIVFAMDGIFSKKIPYSTQFARLVIPIADSLGKISKEFKLPSLTKDVTLKNLINCHSLDKHSQPASLPAKIFCTLEKFMFSERLLPIDS